MSGRRWLYLPGLGTGPRSVKAAALAARLAPRGVALRCLDLRVPSFGRMRVAAMREAARRALDGASSAVLVGTSLGGLVAAQLAAEDARVAALVLCAPALDAPRLRARAPWLAALWERAGWLPLRDKTERRIRLVDAGLLRELDGLVGAAPEARAPTLVLHGRRDWLARVESSRAFARSGADVRLVEFDDGHDLGRSLPAVVAEAERFLAPWIDQDASAARGHAPGASGR